jgi:hypothetical protein
MRTIIILIAAIAIYSTAFINQKCEHVFTSVEQPEVKIEQGKWAAAVYQLPPSGKRDGQELICVKCFHKQRQIIDYGDPRPVSISIGDSVKVIRPFNCAPCVGVSK